MSNSEDSSHNPLPFRHPTEAERRVLEALLTADFPGQKQLLKQLSGLAVRQVDENGSLELVPSSDAGRAVVERRIPVEAELNDRDEIAIHVLLHVMDGLIAELEIYRDDLRPVGRPLSPEDFNLIVL
jgi:hypothetical protein